MSSIRKDIKKILTRVRQSNDGKRIKIRFRQRKNGITFFLDYFHNYKRQTLFYSKQFLGRTDTIKDDDELLAIILKDRDDRDFELEKEKIKTNTEIEKDRQKIEREVAKTYAEVSKASYTYDVYDTRDAVEDLYYTALSVYGWW